VKGAQKPCSQNGSEGGRPSSTAMSLKKKKKEKKKVEQMNDDREYIINGMSIGNIVSKKERKRY
jgi:hypothetical protein